MDHEFNLDGHVGGFCRAIVRGEVDCLSQHGLGGVGVDDDVGVPGGVLSRQSSHPIRGLTPSGFCTREIPGVLFIMSEDHSHERTLFKWLLN